MLSSAGTLSGLCWPSPFLLLLSVKSSSTILVSGRKSGRVTSPKKMILFQRLESAAITAALVFLYHYLGFSWLAFVALILVPDVSMVGYLKDPRVGAAIYNLGHSYFSTLLLLGISLLLDYHIGV